MDMPSRKKSPSPPGANPEANETIADGVIGFVYKRAGGSDSGRLHDPTQDGQSVLIEDKATIEELKVAQNRREEDIKAQQESNLAQDKREEENKAQRSILKSMLLI